MKTALKAALKALLAIVVLVGIARCAFVIYAVVTDAPTDPALLAKADAALADTVARHPNLQGPWLEGYTRARTAPKTLAEHMCHTAFEVRDQRFALNETEFQLAVDRCIASLAIEYQKNRSR